MKRIFGVLVGVVVLVVLTGAKPGGAGSTPAVTDSGGNMITTSPNSLFSGLVTATNGFVSRARNLLAPVSITVGASPYSFTNNAASGGSGTNNIAVMIDGVSVTGTVGINGTTVFNTIGQNTILLQPDDWTTITFTVGTPTAFWKPF